jgi:hypothetical protein
MHMEGIMSNAGEIVKKFYAAVEKRGIAAARRYLSDDLLFLGLFETYRNAEEYIAALTKLLQVVVRLDVKKIIAEDIEPGQTRRVTASLPAGIYTIYCSLPGHRDAGMAATLRVSP